MLGKSTFLVITRICFGHDIIRKIGSSKYIDPSTGSEAYIKFDEFFMNVMRDEIKAYMDPKGKLLPFLASWRLIEPHKTNYTNQRKLIRVLGEFCDKNANAESLYKVLINTGKFTKNECLMD